MDLTVTPDPANPARGHLRFGDRILPCALGRSGLVLDKREGDGATPIGRFPLRRLYFRADRLDAPETGLPVSPLSEYDGWCDAPDDPNYNRFVTHPYDASAEQLWRDDGVYDVIVVLGHNDDPVVPGAGSAIFLHVATNDYAPTQGCVALNREDLLSVLRRCSTESVLIIDGG